MEGYIGKRIMNRFVKKLLKKVARYIGTIIVHVMWILGSAMKCHNAGNEKIAFFLRKTEVSGIGLKSQVS